MKNYMKWLVIQLRQLRQQGPVARLKALIKKAFTYTTRRVMGFLNSQPRLRLFLVTLAKNLGVFEPLRSIYLRSIHIHPAHYISNNNETPVPVSANTLSPRARRIYLEINKEIAKRHKA
jgi:hypothetical protein